MEFQYPKYDQLCALVNTAMEKYHAYQQKVQANTQDCDTQIATLKTQISDKLKSMLTADVSGDSAAKASLEAEIDDLKAQVSKLEEKEKQYGHIDAFDFIRDDLPAISTAYKAVEPERNAARQNLRQSMAELQAQINALQKEYDEQHRELDRIFQKTEEYAARPLRILIQAHPDAKI